MSDNKRVPNPLLLRISGILPLVAIVLAMVAPRVLGWSTTESRSNVIYWQILCGAAFLAFVFAFLVKKEAKGFPKGSMALGVIGLVLGGAFMALMLGMR